MAFNPPLGSTSPAVLLDNAERLDKLVNGPSADVPDRGGDSLYSWRQIMAKFDDVIASMDTGSFTFADESSGLAGTTDGQFFRVIQNGSFIYYRNVGGIAHAVYWYPDGRIVIAQELKDNVIYTQPNLFANNVSDVTALPPRKTGSAVPTISTYNGLPCYSLIKAAGSDNEAPLWLGGHERSSFPGGYISAGMAVIYADASTGVASVRVLLVQHDAAGNEITAARVESTVTVSSQITSTIFAKFSAVPLHVDCANVWLYLGVQSGGQARREVKFTNLLLCDGPVSAFRRIPLKTASESQAIQGTDTTTFLNPQTAARVTDQKMLGGMAQNLMPYPTFESFAENSTPAGWINAIVVSVGNRKCLRTPSATSAIASDGPLIDVSALSGKHISVAMDIVRKIGDQGIDSVYGQNNLRARLVAYTADGTEIANAWTGVAGNDDTSGTIVAEKYYTRNIPRSDISEPYRLNLARNILVPANAATIRITIRAENNGSTPAPFVYIDNFVFVNAPDAIMFPAKLARTAAYTGGNNINFITEAMAAQVAKSKSFWNDLPNWFPDSQLKNASEGAAVAGWDNNAKAVMKGGYMTVEQPPANTVIAVGTSLLPGIPVSTSKFPSGYFSAAVDIMEKLGDQGAQPNGQNNLRIRIWARDASGQLINTAWSGVSGNDDAAFPTGPQYYTRYVPRASITSRTRLVIAENIPVPAGAAYLIFNIRAEGATGFPCPQMYLTNFATRNGADASWSAEALGSGSSAVSVVYLSPIGSDSNTGASLSSPLKTLAAAVEKIGGVGNVYVSAGNYDLSNFQVPFSAISSVKIQGITTTGFAHPVIRGGKKLTGITKLAGYSRIYQAPLTGFAAGTHPSWLWLDDFPDADTLEQPEDYHPMMRGRANRLECTKIWLADTVRTAINRDTPVSWDKAVALAEMDGSHSPKCTWVESEGVVYFTLPNGGDATAFSASIYAAPAVQGVFTGSENQFNGKGSVSVCGIHLRYARMGTWGFRQTILDDVTVLGAAENCFDIGNWTIAYNCKAAGAGSRNFLGTYDGYNMHNFSVFTHYSCWSTDCLDDGWSSHENCTEFGYAPMATFNLGSGLTPAYGAEALYINPLTRGNALQTRKLNSKSAGIESHQGPIPADPGVATVVMVKGGLSVDDYNGYISGDTGGAPNASNLVAIDCKAINPVQYGYRCTKIIDCAHGGTGQAKHPNTKVTVSTTKITG
ncbi:hypothetical protein FMK94_04995 [Klebsiella grimontii]|uniref:hypothetical protein n=1 Tax=Klebsiella grimontii TaxID=2058152 RepID=UPI001CCD93BB|nr:hypothetical protein [Klebsiella grimontii]MBZ7513629.1 hypothetical protein [Klebsiella grimontii]